MSEQRTTWLRLSLAAIASVYAIFGVCGAVQLVYGILISGSSQGGPKLLDSLIPLFLAFGLFTLRPWARILGLIVSGFLLFVGLLGFVFCLGHLLNLHPASGGLILSQPVLAIGSLILLTAFAGWQWWVLSRPSIRSMFCEGGN